MMGIIPLSQSRPKSENFEFKVRGLLIMSLKLLWFASNIRVLRPQYFKNKSI